MRIDGKMSKYITFNILKSVDVKNSPFETIVYSFRNQDRFLIENVKKEKTSIANQREIQDILRLTYSTEWIELFNNQFIKFHNNTVDYFLPIFQESFKRCFMSFRINKRMLPIDVTLLSSISSFKTDNFELFIGEPEDDDLPGDKNTKIKKILIECIVPLFQVFMIVQPKVIYNRDRKLYSCQNSLVVMKYENNFYHFPYGNVSTDGHMCMGYNNQSNINHETQLADVCFVKLVSSQFNGDYIPQIKFNESSPILLDIDKIREKVTNNDFNISFIDVLLYLSTCEKPQDINTNIFLLSPNVPKEIEKCFKFYNTISDNSINEALPVMGLGEEDNG